MVSESSLYILLLNFFANIYNIHHSFLMQEISGDRKTTPLHLITLAWRKKESHFQQRTRRFGRKLV